MIYNWRNLTGPFTQNLMRTNKDYQRKKELIISSNSYELIYYLLFLTKSTYINENK